MIGQRRGRCGWKEVLAGSLAVLAIVVMSAEAEPGGDAAPPFTKPAATILRQHVTPEQFDVTQNAATEPPFRSASPAGTPTRAAAARELATLAGGCFWGMQEILRGIPGVLTSKVGYTGGSLPNASYEDVHGGASGHAEAVEMWFDPQRISYEELLGYFFRMHDPTTPNRQGNDVGSSYRSAIFYHSETQRETAERVKSRVNASGKWPAKVVTEIVPAGPFYQAEEDHQDYLQKHPNGYTCHFLRD